VDAWRWINGAGDDAPSGLTIDCYRHEGTQAWLVVGAREHLGQEEVARAWAKAAGDRVSAVGVVLKRLSRSVRESTSELIFGAPPPSPVRVREDDAVFLCELDDGISTGLFLDQREVRRRSRDFASGREVLNLFAYTCAFSVHAALAGARRVTSVDVSKKALRRGRENMSASGLDPNRHRWFDDDVFAFLARQRKKAPAYELVVADPPVFGRARGATFALERELPLLLSGCIAATAPSGVVVFSTHLLSVEQDVLVAAARAAAAGVSRSITVLETMGLPEWDHPAVSASDDRGNYLKTLVLRVE
jgi:23S rRNA (cytosine1962-C5)-methyltransferase